MCRIPPMRDGNFLAVTAICSFVRSCSRSGVDRSWPGYRKNTGNFACVLTRGYFALACPLR